MAATAFDKWIASNGLVSVRIETSKGRRVRVTDPDLVELSAEDFKSSGEMAVLDAIERVSISALGAATEDWYAIERRLLSGLEGEGMRNPLTDRLS